MSKPLTFGSFVLDARNARLEREGVPVELPPKAFGLLCLLAQRPGELVTKDEMLDAVWGRRFVSESVLKTAVNAIRSALQTPQGVRFSVAPPSARPESPRFSFIVCGDDDEGPV